MIIPTSKTSDVLDEVFAERRWQDEKWGGPEHDDAHSVQEFVAFIHEHAEKAIAPGTSPNITCSRLVEVAALAVAAVEAIRRKQKAKSQLDRSGSSASQMSESVRTALTGQPRK